MYILLHIKFFNFRQLVLFSALLVMFVANAAALNISNVPLELTPSLPPNVLILADDSGSMDWEVLTQHSIENSGALCAPTISGGCDFAGIIHRVPEGGAPGAPATCEPYVSLPPIAPPLVATEDFVNGYIYGVRFPGDPAPTDGTFDDEIQNCYVAAGDDFRFRSAAFNPLYFDPGKTYTPWIGTDINGNAYVDAEITNAPNDPYLDPTDAKNRINLTTDLPGVDTLGNRLTGNGFKYYDWDDANGNGIFEVGEETEHFIRDFLPSGPTPNAERIINFANWFTYYRKREYVAKAIASHAVAGRNSAYFDYATINQSVSNELRIDRTDTTYFDNVDANQSALLDAITRSITSTNRTPLRTGLDKVGKYFQCAADDIFNSAGSTSAGNSNCPILAAPSGECQFNSTFVFTDGFNNEAGVVGDEDDGPSSDFDGFAFEDGRPNTLADVAMLYYETDLSSLTDNVPVTSVDFSRDPNPGTLAPGDLLHQHMKTNTVGIFNNLGTSPVNTSFPADVSILNTNFWSDPDVSFEGKMQDLVHTSYNGRGNFVSVFDNSDFSAAINEVESSFSRAASNFGSTTAVAFNSSSITQDTLVFRTFSNLATNSGELVAQRVNFDGSFNVDSSGNPVFEWSAAALLDDDSISSPSSRNILTYEADENEGREFDITANPATSGLSILQRDRLRDPNPTIPVNNTFEETRVDYLRGDDSNEGTDIATGEMRVRESTDTNGIRTGARLGDIVHSSPVYVGQPPFANRFGGAFPSTAATSYFTFRVSNQARDPLVYVGANDGMLHAFEADTGVEKFAYVPNALLDKLVLYTSQSYDHQFYVDSTPSVNDVFIEPNGSGPSEWRTVLVNGLGAGGQGYFALDITDPNSIDEDSVMWEFTDEDDVDLGFSYSVPIIAMSNDTDLAGNRRWVAIFGNGYNNRDADGFQSATGNAAIYIVFLEEGYDGWTAGSDFKKLDTLEGDLANPNGIGGITGIDINGDGTVDRLYAGDLLGNVHVVDMSSPDDTSWNFTPNLLFTATYESGAPTMTTPQPITTKPTVIENTATRLIPDDYIVIVGTGSYFTTDDALNTDIQSIYGLWDNPSDPSTISKYSPSDLVEQEFSTQVDNNGFVIRTVSLSTVDYTAATPPRGWFIDFDIPPPGSNTGVQFPGERPVRNLQLRNNQLFFSTVIPQDGMSCSATSGGFGLSVDPFTGSVGTEVIFDINIDGLFDESDNLNGATGQANIVVGTQFESSPGDSTFIGDYRVTQLSNTNVDRILVNPDLNSGGSLGALLGRHSWKEIR